MNWRHASSLALLVCFSVKALSLNVGLWVSKEKGVEYKTCKKQGQNFPLLNWSDMKVGKFYCCAKFQVRITTLMNSGQGL